MMRTRFLNYSRLNTNYLIKKHLEKQTKSRYISIALVLGYLVAGTLFYTFAPRELNDAGKDLDKPDAGFVDGFYYTVVSLTTVGYGDVVPYTKGKKMITFCIYCLVYFVFFWVLDHIMLLYEKISVAFYDSSCECNCSFDTNGE